MELPFDFLLLLLLILVSVLLQIDSVALPQNRCVDCLECAMLTER